MGFFDYFRSTRNRNTASLAKERLQIIVAHERSSRHQRAADFIPQLKQELLDVVRKYVAVSPEQIKVHVDREDGCEVLELNILLSDDEAGDAKA